jgi:hypothetical protein
MGCCRRFVDVVDRVGIGNPLGVRDRIRLG